MTTSTVTARRSHSQRCHTSQPARPHLSRRQIGERAYHWLEQLGVDAWVQITRRGGEPVHGRYKKRVGNIIWLKWGAGYWAVDITDMISVCRLADPADSRRAGGGKAGLEAQVA